MNSKSIPAGLPILRPLVIVCASAKGGTGKTTVAINLARAIRGAVLIDSGAPQYSAVQWAKLRAKREWLPKINCFPAAGQSALSSALEDAARTSSSAVIDTPPSINATVIAAVKRADAVLLMTRPNFPDLAAIGAAAKKLTNVAPGRIILAVNQCSPADSPYNLIEDVKPMATKYGLATAPPLPTQDDFATTFAVGKAAMDDAFSLKTKAAGEIRTLIQWIRKFVNKVSKWETPPRI